MTNRLQIAKIFILILIISGCSAGTMVVLAPNPDGKTGAITVSNTAGSVDIETPYHATTVKSGTESPHTPVAVSSESLAIFSDALSVQPKAPVHFILYFEKDLLLTADSARLMTEIMAAITERNSSDIFVVGHTDSVGSKEYNMTLSKNRAGSVRDLLVRKGIDAGYIKTTSHGKENPLIKTDDNVNEPKNRRVEVVVR